MMSSFFWISPCTFSESADPITSPSAPLLTAMAMCLQARATTSISRRSCDGMRPCSRCCSTRYWVRLLFLGMRISWEMRDAVVASARVTHTRRRNGRPCETGSHRDPALQESVLQRAVDDLAHVRAQVRLGGHAHDRL